MIPIEELKIDRSFIATMTSDIGNAHIVEGVVALAHKLGLATVAEGVEDEETLDALREIGCDVAQGFLLGRPMPAEAFDDWMQSFLVGAPDQRADGAGAWSGLDPTREPGYGPVSANGVVEMASDDERRDDERLLARAEEALTEIKVSTGLSEPHAAVLAALRIRLKGDPGSNLDDLLAAAGDLEGPTLDDAMNASKAESPVRSTTSCRSPRSPSVPSTTSWASRVVMTAPGTALLTACVAPAIVRWR